MKFATNLNFGGKKRIIGNFTILYAFYSKFATFSRFLKKSSFFPEFNTVFIPFLRNSTIWFAFYYKCATFWWWKNFLKEIVQFCKIAINLKKSTQGENDFFLHIIIDTTILKQFARLPMTATTSIPERHIFATWKFTRQKTVFFNSLFFCIQECFLVKKTAFSK